MIDDWKRRIISGGNHGFRFVDYRQGERSNFS